MAVPTKFVIIVKAQEPELVDVNFVLPITFSYRLNEQKVRSPASHGLL